MKSIPILLFSILMIRDAKKFIEVLVETNEFNKKDFLGILAMLFGIGIDLFFYLE